MIISPSDHIVMNVAEFQRVINKGLEFTAQQENILTLGMMPTRPETGYGYIKAVMGEDSGENIPYSMLPLDGTFNMDLIPNPAESPAEILI